IDQQVIVSFLERTVLTTVEGRRLAADISPLLDKPRIVVIRECTCDIQEVGELDNSTHMPGVPGPGIRFGVTVREPVRVIVEVGLTDIVECIGLITSVVLPVPGC